MQIYSLFFCAHLLLVDSIRMYSHVCCNFIRPIACLERLEKSTLGLLAGVEPATHELFHYHRLGCCSMNLNYFCVTYRY